MISRISARVSVYLQFCCGRLDELRAVLPDWALPEHNPKKPGSVSRFVGVLPTVF